MMYRNHEKAAKVRGRLPGAADVDPEAVLAFDPDLIVLTLTHGAELDALELLSLSGIPIVSIRRSEEHTSELQSRENLVCRLLLEKKNKSNTTSTTTTSI